MKTGFKLPAGQKVSGEQRHAQRQNRDGEAGAQQQVAGRTPGEVGSIGKHAGVYVLWAEAFHQQDLRPDGDGDEEKHHHFFHALAEQQPFKEAAHGSGKQDVDRNIGKHYGKQTGKCADGGAAGQADEDSRQDQQHFSAGRQA